MGLVLDVGSWAAILVGLFFMIVGTVGVLRMPDVFTRLHAAGMTDTMGAGFLILGMCLQAGLSLLTLRLLIVYAFLMVTSPIGTHALARAALGGDIVPVRGEAPEE
ncbi:MAG: monovalent cation/H(+) antiporter subunit G [Gemmatimonadota bacterium]